jgi:hypothetical protein
MMSVQAVSKRFTVTEEIRNSRASMSLTRKLSQAASKIIAVLIAVLVSASAACAHGIAGNRYFPGTLTFDDPAVADELFMPLYDRLEHPTREGGEATDDAFSLTFLRLLTPRLAIGGDATWLRRVRDGFSTRTGFGITHLLIKGLVYENDPHETLISASLIWGVGDFGTKAVGGYGPNTLQPSLTFGKGFGDLPDNLKWLRPFAIVGAISPELPINGRTKTLLFDPSTDQSRYGYMHNPDIVHWAFALEFSTLYLTSRFTGGPPKEEPLNQLVPLIEFPVDTTITGGRFTNAATMNPGLSYVGVVYQVAAEAIVPLNGQGGHGVGVTAGLEFFLDDLAPSLFAKPLLEP